MRYLERKILPRNPFETIDEDGVGRLMKMAVTEGRKTRRNLEVGICGEHGGDPDSIHLCNRLGLNYVSCSPFRVPVARLAAAQAAIGERAGGPAVGAPHRPGAVRGMAAGRQARFGDAPRKADAGTAHRSLGAVSRPVAQVHVRHR